MKITRGIYLIDKNDNLLIAHATNGNIWSIPKGRPEEGEDFYGTACREFLEETSINLDDHDSIICERLPDRIYRTGKRTLESMYIKIDKEIDIVNFVCECLVDSPRPFPENDDFKWIPLEEAKNYLHEAQLTNIELINDKRR